MRDNRDFNTAANDETDFIGSRLRLDIHLHPIKELEFFVQPQYSGAWGQVESSQNAVATQTINSFTSGALNDRELQLHQGYILWHALSNASFKIGRQELAYGDHVVLGNVGFSNVGRSFDAALVKLHYSNLQADVFYSQLAEDDFNGTNLSGDIDLAGVYSNYTTQWNAVPFIENYLIWLKDQRSGSPNNFNFVTLGTRAIYEHENYYGRIEANLQVGKRLNQDMLAYMFIVEQGAKIDFLHGFDFAVEYNHASGDDPSSGKFTRYHQLFPTAHKWLGYLDFFGRQNIQSAVAKLVLNLHEKWTATAHIHSFWRVRTSDVLYGLATEAPLAGQTTPPTSNARHVGEEVDLVLSYKPIKQIALEAFGGFLLPAGYLENAVGSDTAYFTYLQTTFNL